jgi:mono/diheme cytochrome c family protein
VDEGRFKNMNWKGALFVIASVAGAFFLVCAPPPAISADSSFVAGVPAQSGLSGSNERNEEAFTSPADFFLGWPTRGKVLFQQKCARCHTIGHGVKVGPDLKNITAKGPRQYLFNFIMNPDKYIKENHPIAVELLKHLV